jgi:hypothetical protein
MISIRVLDGHKRVGVDFDGTLVDEPKSSILVDYIIKNFKTTDFVIVTFRSHGMENEIWHILEMVHGKTGIKRDMFKGVVNIPNEMYENYLNDLDQLFIRRRAGLEIPKIMPGIEAYRTWKGSVCYDAKLSVMIDDKPEDVEAGCRQFGVDFIDIRTITP